LYHGRSNRKTAIPDLSVSEDPSDDKFVECAVAGKADIIISSDRHLLDLDGYRDIHVCNAGTFLKEKAE
jgi:predicted nucleic acid-binding protein